MATVQSIDSALFITGCQKKKPENNTAAYHNALQNQPPLRKHRAHQIYIFRSQNRSRRADNQHRRKRHKEYVKGLWKIFIFLFGN